MEVLLGLEHRSRSGNHAFLFCPQSVFYIIEIGANV